MSMKLITGLCPLAVPALLVAAGFGGGAAQRFIIVQPGYPGSTAEAEGFVSELAQAIASGGGPANLSGEYHNETSEALKALEKEKPAFGVVSLGFFLAQEKALNLVPLAESRPPQRFYLAGRKGETLSPSDLAGKPVAGTAFEEKEFVERILFGHGSGGGALEGQAPASPPPGPQRSAVEVRLWKVEPSSGFTKAVRDTARGRVAAVLLNEREKRSLTDLTAGKSLEVYHATEPLPTALVVAFGEPGAEAKKAAKALEKLEGSAEGKRLLETMGIAGFAAADQARLEKLRARYHGVEKGGGEKGEADRAGGPRAGAK